MFQVKSCPSVRHTLQVGISINFCNTSCLKQIQRIAVVSALDFILLLSFRGSFIWYVSTIFWKIKFCTPWFAHRHVCVSEAKKYWKLCLRAKLKIVHEKLFLKEVNYAYHIFYLILVHSSLVNTCSIHITQLSCFVLAYTIAVAINHLKNFK